MTKVIAASEAGAGGIHGRLRGALRCWGQRSVQPCSSAAVCSSVTCNANFFDTNGGAADGGEAPCGAVDNGVCSTGLSAKVCSLVTCSSKFFDTNRDGVDGCEAPFGAVDNGPCSSFHPQSCAAR